MTVSFNQNPHGLSISYETERLNIHSYRKSDLPHSVKLYGDERITPLFDHGKPRSKEETEKLVHKIGLQMFQQNSMFGLFSAYTKDGDKFVGHFDILPAHKDGTVEIGYIISHEQQKKGYGFEIAKSIVEQYAPAILKRDATVNGNPLKKIVATVHNKNIGSKKILNKIGMKFIKTIEKENWEPRLFYSMKIIS